MWAQIFENLVDQRGRQIRYGGSPSSSTPHRLRVLNHLGALSEIIDNYESTATGLAISKEALEALAAPSNREFRSDLEQVEPTPAARDSIKEGYVSLRDKAIELFCLIEADKRRRGRIIRRRCPSRENPELADIDALTNWLVPVITKRLKDARLELTRREEELRSILAFLAEEMNEVH